MAKSRTIKSNLVRLFENSTAPVYLLNENRKIVYANSALSSWTGIDGEKLTSLTCNYHTEALSDASERIAAALCPQPRVFQGNRQQTSIQFIDHQGNTCCRNVMFVPMSGDEGTTVLAVVDENEAEQASFDTSDELHRQLNQMRLDLGKEFRLDYFVGKSPAAVLARRKASAAARSGAETIVVGPAGSGRQFLCRAIHHSSSGYFNQNSSSQELFEGMIPLYPVDCPLCDAESIQFAIKDLFGLAESESKLEGRLLLLDVDRLAESGQNELLGFLELPDFNLGLLATATVPLVQLVKENRFSPRLARFLSTIEIELPELSARSKDIPLLTQVFVENFNARGGKQLSGFSSDAVDALLQYAWPGNIHELRDFVFAACQASDSDPVSLAALPERIGLSQAAQQHKAPTGQTVKLDEFLEQIEMQLVERALQQARGNKSKAAQMLSVSRQRVIRWADKIDPARNQRAGEGDRD